MDAVICGAGIAGLALAQRLVHHGWRVTMVEHANGPREQGYMIDFFGLGYDAAERMGVLPRLHELGYAVDELAYVDARGRRRAGADYRRFADAVDGRLLSIMRGDLERALREQVAADVDLRFATTVTGWDERPDGVDVSLSDGDTIAADLLVGADGIHSRVRALAFGAEERFLRHLGLHTAAFVFDDRPCAPWSVTASP